MNKLLTSHLLFNASFLLFCVNIQSQSNTIGIMDFYGMEKVKESTLRSAIGIKEGDTMDFIDKGKQIQKLRAVPGVKRSDISMVCCTEKGQSMIYIGISEKDNNSSITYHTTPTSKINLPAEIIKAADEFSEVFSEGIEKGESGEDRSQGHSFMNYAPARAIQEKFVTYAAKYLPALKNVLKNSNSDEQRAIAAQ